MEKYFRITPIQVLLLEKYKKITDATSPVQHQQ